MKKCKKCDAILLPGANFCHKCGTSAKEETPLENIITQTSTTLFDAEPIVEEDAEEIVEVISEIPTADFYDFNSADAIDFEVDTKTTYNQTAHQKPVEDLLNLKAIFFESLRNRVVEEHNSLLYSDYVERFYRVDFQQIMASRFELWAEECKRMEQKGASKDQILHLEQKMVTSLLNYFIIKECAELNEIPFSEKMLRYDDMKLQDLQMNLMIQDFLQLDEEKNIVVYKNFITMPPEKLETAIKSFAKAPREERLFFIADATITGTCKEGFALTNEAIYWKAPLEKAQRLTYQSIKSVTRHKDWIEINGHFFNIHKSLNLRLLRMLKVLVNM